MAIFYFRRLNIEPIFEEQGQKTLFVKKGLLTNATATSGEFLYKFFEVTDDIIQIRENVQERFLVGSLVKYDPKASTEMVNEQGELVVVDQPNAVVSKAKFFFHLSSSILTFNETGAITSNTFTNVFEKLFIANHGDIQREVALTAINDEYVFVNKVKTFSKIKKVTIDIVLSNPHASPIWEGVEKDLKNRNINSFKEIQEHKGEGNGIILDEETNKKFVMAEDGYGTATVSGEINGEHTKISTNDRNKQTQERIDIPSNETNLNIIKKLWNKMTGVIKRTNNEEEN